MSLMASRLRVVCGAKLLIAALTGGAGVEMPENLPSSVFAEAWAKLYAVFGEQLNQDALDMMDAVWNGVVADMQDELQRQVAEDEG